MKRPPELVAGLLAFGLTGLVCAALVWPLPLHLGTWHASSAFGDSHVWVWDHLWAWLFEGERLEPTCRAGYPNDHTFRAIGLGPGLVVGLLRPMLGPLGAANLVQLLSLPLSALVAALLVRRWTGASSVSAGLLGACYGLCPNLLATFATLEISNTQAWIPPALLLSLEQAGRRWWGLLLVAGTGLVAAMTSPYLALSLPLLAGGWAVATLWTGRRTPLRALTRGGLALLALFLSLLPAGSYYKQGLASGKDSLFEPAQRKAMFQAVVPDPPPVAELDRLFFGTVARPETPLEPGHTVYLGLALVLLAGALVLWRRGAHPGGVALTLGGGLLSLGPYLSMGGQAAFYGLSVPTPIAWLEMLGYPTAQGGMYYRYSVLVVLGLVVVVGRAVAGWRWAAPTILSLFLVQVADGVRDTGPFWPRPVEEVPGLELLLTMRGTDGAVLELPLQRGRNPAHGQDGMLRAVFHDRPTTALPRDPAGGNLGLTQLMSGLAADPQGTALSLSTLGFRYVVLPLEQASTSEPGLEALREALGEPDHEGALYVWDLGPAVVSCRPIQADSGRRRRRR